MLFYCGKREIGAEVLAGIIKKPQWFRESGRAGKHENYVIFLGHARVFLGAHMRILIQSDTKNAWDCGCLSSCRSRRSFFFFFFEGGGGDRRFSEVCAGIADSALPPGHFYSQPVTRHGSLSGDRIAFRNLLML